MKKNILLLLLTGATMSGFSQHKAPVASDASELEIKIRSAIAKAYPASVFLADYDTTKKVRNGMRFSGVVVRQDGLIMTAAHVCQPDKIYQVIFPDGRQCIARGLGRIGSVDAALMKIDSAGTYPFAEMGWSSSMRIHEACISIAYPGTFDPDKPVVRVGYVADTTSGRRGGPQMRTTALMEPGDSGGPIFDLLGRVIGVCSRVTLPLDNNYEVPVDAFRKYWTALNKPQNYTRLPEAEPIPVDPLRDQHTLSIVFPNANDHFAPLASSLADACVRVKSQQLDSTTYVMGTVLSPEIKRKGYIISKSSSIGERPRMLTTKGSVSLKVIARDSTNDLVLLEAPHQLPGGVIRSESYLDSVNFQSLGRMLVSAFPDTIGCEASIVGSMQLSLPRKASSGQLGVNVEAKEAALFISKVVDNTAASEARLLAGDKVVSVNGISFDTPESFSKGLMQYDPGDRIQLVAMRNDSLFTKDIVLRKRMIEPHVAHQFTDGRSVRRDGFTQAFIHDARLKPQECGGPVFDASGQFRGINIARTSRTSSIAIPASAVWQFIDTVLPSSKPRKA
jgi:serine protease Do